MQNITIREIAPTIVASAPQLAPTEIGHANTFVLAYSIAIGFGASGGRRITDGSNDLNRATFAFVLRGAKETS